MKRLGVITAAQYRAKATKAISEETLHRRVAVYLGRVLRPPTIWSTFPSGGGGKMRGMRLRAMGLQAGWPDILVLDLGSHLIGAVTVIGIELKSKKGTLSPEQKTVQASFALVGAKYEVARSLDDVRDILEMYRVPMHARLS